MLQFLMLFFPNVVNRVHPPLALAIAAAGLLFALVGARYTRAIVGLSLVSAGTVIGLQMPRWFGWGIDPMGTAFGTAIVLGLSGYILSTMWEGMFLATLFAAMCGAIVWLRLAPHTGWHPPHIDWSATATEIGYTIWQSLPPAINRALPVGIGIGATIGTLLIVFAPRLARVSFYAVLGTTSFVLASLFAVSQTHPSWIWRLPQNGKIQVGIFGLAIIFSFIIQWLFLPKNAKVGSRDQSDKTGGPNRFVANGPALRVQSRNAGFNTSFPRISQTGPRSYKMVGKMR